MLVGVVCLLSNRYLRVVPLSAKFLTNNSRQFIRGTVFAGVITLAGSLLNTSLAATASWSSAFADGENSLRSGKPSNAVSSFRTALALVQKQSKDPSEIDSCKLKLAAALRLTGKVAESRAMLQRLLVEVKKANDGSRVSKVLMALGSIEESAGNHAGAMGYYNQALTAAEKNYGPYSPEAARALYGLGRTNSKTGQKQAATDSYQRAISILSKDPNLESAEELKSIMHEYADLIKSNDSSSDSLLKDFQKDILKKDSPSQQPSGWHETGIRTTIAADAGTTTGGSPSSNASASSNFQQQTDFRLRAQRTSDTGDDEKIALRGLQAPASEATLRPAFKVLNDTLVDQARYNTSEEQYQRMIATDINSLGPNHPSVGNDLRGLALLYIARGKFQDARPLLQKALTIYEGAYGARNVMAISTGSSLALVEARLGNRDQAIALYNKELATAQATLGPGNIETAKILNALGYLYFQQGLLDKSSTVYEWALASTQKAVGDKDPLLAACLKDYAQVLRRLDQNNKASQLEERAGQISGQ